MTAEQQSELWRWAVHNKSFQLMEDLHNLRSTLIALAGPEAFAHDKWCIAERQSRICELELDKLRGTIRNINFKPKNYVAIQEEKESSG